MSSLNKFNYLIINILLLLSFQLKAQNIVIKGKVMDELSKEPLHFCHVHVLNTKTKTITNQQGEFTISITDNSTNIYLISSFIGYKTDTMLVSNRNNVSIYLKPIENLTNEVTVTGVSKATRINENPVSINIVGEKTIDRSNESNIIDVLTKNVSGLNAVKTGPNISKPFIRGLGYNRVLTLYDGVRQEGQQWGDEHGIEVDAYNIEKAEVIKGPASLMYGSDALAGVVSLIPSTPKIYDSTLHLKTFSEYQSNNGLIGNGIRLNYANQQWTYSLKSSYRLAHNYQNAIDKYVYNTGFRETNVSSSIAYKSTKGLTSLNITLYNNYQGIPDGSRDSLTRKFTKQIYESDLDDIKNRPIVSTSELKSYQLSPLIQQIEHYRIYGNHAHHFKSGDIDVLIAFQQNIRKEYNHPTDVNQPGMSVELNTVNYSIKYNTKTISNIDFSFGSNGMIQSNTNKNATDFPIPDYQLYDAGVYGYSKWKYDQLTISGGIRYDNRTIKGNDFYTKLDPITQYQQHVTDSSGAYLQFPSFNKTFNGISFSIGSTYLINENISLKANIGRGYRAPSITEFASNGLDPGAHIVYLGNRNFNPEFSLQEDFGINGVFKNVSASVSIFNNNINNYIYLSQLIDQNGNPVVIVKGNKTYQYQQDAAQLYGTEITFDLHPKLLKGFTLNNSMSYVFGVNKKAAYQNKGIEGEYLPFIPPLKIQSSINQNINLKSQILSNFNIKAEIEYSAAQNKYLALENTETATPSFTLFNISSGIDLKLSKKSSLQILGQINNVFDLAYQSNLSRLKYFEYYTNSPNGKLGMYGMGRNMCIKLIMSI